MSSVAPLARQGLVAAWLAQMIGTMVLAGAVMIFVRVSGPLSAGESDWKKYAMLGILAGIAPALLYLPTFKARLDADERAARVRTAIAALPEKQRHFELIVVTHVDDEEFEWIEAAGKFEGLLKDKIPWDQLDGGAFDALEVVDRTGAQVSHRHIDERRARRRRVW